MKQAYEIGTNNMEGWTEFKEFYKGNEELEQKLKLEAHMGMVMLAGQDEDRYYLVNLRRKQGWECGSEKEIRAEKEYQRGIFIKKFMSLVRLCAIVKTGEESYYVRDSLENAITGNYWSTREDANYWLSKAYRKELLKTKEKRVQEKVYRKGVDITEKILVKVQKFIDCKSMSKEGILSWLLEDGKEANYWTSETDERWLAMKERLLKTGMLEGVGK